MAWTTSGDKKVDFPFNEDKKKEGTIDSNQLQPNSNYCFIIIEQQMQKAAT